MNSHQAIEHFKSECEKYYKYRVAFLRAESRSSLSVVRYPVFLDVNSLDDLPKKPGVVWIVRPSNWEGGDEFASAFKWNPVIVVNSPKRIAAFKRGSGRSINGRNALRHGRINWKETHDRFMNWWNDTISFSKSYSKSIEKINKKLCRKAWDETDDLREYVVNNHMCYSLTRPADGKGLFVSCAHHKHNLPFQTITIFNSVEELKSRYPFFQSV